MDYTEYLRPLNQGRALGFRPVEIINKHSRLGPQFIGQAVRRLETALQRSGFRIVAPDAGHAKLKVALTYLDPYESAWAGYETSVEVIDALGAMVLSERTTSFPSKVKGHEIYDWVPIVPLQLTAVLTKNPQPLIDAMWGRFGEGESGSAIALKYFPSQDVVKNLLEISRTHIRIMLKFGADSAQFVLVTDAGDRVLGAAEYQALHPLSATQENAFHSILSILGGSEGPSIVSQVAADHEWVADHLEAMIGILQRQIYGPEHRRGIVSLLRDVKTAPTVEVLRTSAQKDADASVREAAGQALA